MDALKTSALVLIVCGVLALIYGGFSYSQDTQAAKIGPIELTVSETKTVNIPVWAGIGAIAIGGGLMLTRRWSSVST
ncbi:MAG: hypothetical protein AB7I01_09050 [Gammaproteobacteria bacterium]